MMFTGYQMRMLVMQQVLISSSKAVSRLYQRVPVRAVRAMAVALHHLPKDLHLLAWIDKQHQVIREYLAQERHSDFINSGKVSTVKAGNYRILVLHDGAV